jgi:hypothetical protein
VINIIDRGYAFSGEAGHVPQITEQLMKFSLSPNTIDNYFDYDKDGTLVGNSFKRKDTTDYRAGSNNDSYNIIEKLLGEVEQQPQNNNNTNINPLQLRSNTKISYSPGS